MKSKWKIQRGLLIYDCACHTTTNWIASPVYADKQPDPKCCTIPVAKLPSDLASRLRGSNTEEPKPQQRKAAIAVF